VAREKKKNAADNWARLVRTNEPVRTSSSSRVTARDSPTARKDAVAELDEEGTGGAGGLQSGGGASPPPPRPGGSSREALERRERWASWSSAGSGELELGGYFEGDDV
jgi:hypothetical protein